jgi:hypothetical protein
MEFLLITALLLPLYCFAMISFWPGSYVACYLHGGMFRCWLAMEGRWYNPMSAAQGWIADVTTGLAAFGGDAAWYLLLAACGAWAAATHGAAWRIWTRGLAAGGSILLALTAVEWLGIDFWGLWRLLHPTGPAWVPADLLSYRPFDHYATSGQRLAWPLCWLGVCVALRLLAAWFLLRRAARNFDRVAVD